MSFWKRLFGAKESLNPQPPFIPPKQAISQRTPPEAHSAGATTTREEQRHGVIASASVSSETTAIFVWKADVMPTSYGRAAQDALSTAFRIALRSNPAEVLSLEARAGDALGPNPIGGGLRSFLMSLNAETANVDGEVRASIGTGKALDYVPYVVVVNAKSDSIRVAHQELVGKQVLGYLGVISINPAIPLASVEGRLFLPLASLQISSGRRELSDPELIQFLAEAEKESDRAKTVALCDHILTKNPDCSDGHNLRGWALKELNRIDEAESAYRRAIEIDPRHAAALWNLSYIVGSKRGNYRDAVLLIDRAIDLGPPFVRRAISERARYVSLAEEVEQLRQRGVEGNTAKESVTTTEEPSPRAKTTTDETVHDVARSGDLEKVEALLKNNADLVLSKGNVGQTPLHDAAEEGHKKVAELLLAAKAEINAKDKYGNTPLHMAAWRGHNGVAELLLAKQGRRQCEG